MKTVLTLMLKNICIVTAVFIFMNELELILLIFLSPSTTDRIPAGRLLSADRRRGGAERSHCECEPLPPPVVM